MNERLRAHFTELLLEERNRAVDSRDRILARQSHAEQPESPRLAYDEPIVGAIGGGPRDDEAIATREVAALAEIDAALRVLYDSPETYGICLKCGQAIDTARLELLPATRYCTSDASR